MDNSWIDPSKVPTLIAGAVGAFVSVLFQKDTNKLQIVTTIVVAEAVDYYFAAPVWQLLHDKFGWADGSWQGPVAFTLGLFSIWILGGLTKMASQFWGNPWDALAGLLVAVAKRFVPGKAD